MTLIETFGSMTEVLKYLDQAKEVYGRLRQEYTQEWGIKRLDDLEAAVANITKEEERYVYKVRLFLHDRKKETK